MLLQKWHSWLAMPAFDQAWHERDMADELAEYHEETKLLKKWSELSDVVYTSTRGQWSGHPIAFPLQKWQFPIGVIYMIPKYTGRFLFYKRAGKRAGADKIIRCVRNPKKLHKLDDIIVEQQITVDREKLREICENQLKHWPLLP
ncbi:MAG TPA: hypothetical protein VHT70_05265 [Candidatus Saccharimonadales bacterium]|nr:hypothetical protein [Candidatus Saccharimonadales bacterium]